MNFQDLKKIEKPQFYLDVAFNRATKKIKELKQSKKEKDQVKKAKSLEHIRIDIIESNLNDPLRQIISCFPSIDSLDKFYVELIKCTLDYSDLKKSLGSVDWAVKKISLFSKEYKRRASRLNEIDQINKNRREYYGRISSVLKQIKKYLLYLEEARKTMRNYPDIKTSCFTVCIFGFPNVGKSTLLSKITPANPEINSYAFTTKGLNLGYINLPGNKIQIIDTPGTLNRKEKMNYIELQAYLAATYVADTIVYVFDPTDTYDINDQKKLLKRAKEFDKDILIYLSKTDKASEESVTHFKEKYKDIITDSEVLKEKLIKNSKKHKK